MIFVVTVTKKNMVQLHMQKVMKWKDGDCNIVCLMRRILNNFIKFSLIALRESADKY